MIRLVLVAAWLAMIGLTPAVAQPAPVSPLRSPEFLSRFDFHLSVAGLAEDDDRFSWDARVGGDFDIVDYVVGRLTILADYQAILGKELQPFDPNQGNYVLATSSSVRIGPNEVVVLYHHLSRHLSDRAKDFGITVNTLAGQLKRQFETRGTTIELRADAGRVIHAVYLDYTWISNAEFVLRRRASSRVDLFSRVRGEFYGVDPAVAGRDDQQGGRVEGGVRLTGAAAALELFAGYEKVVDADPIELQPHQWAFAGIRIIDR